MALHEDELIPKIDETLYLAPDEYRDLPWVGTVLHASVLASA